MDGVRKKGGEFEFTVVFPSMKYREHDIFSKGRITRELMSEIQRVINNFYTDYQEYES